MMDYSGPCSPASPPPPSNTTFSPTPSLNTTFTPFAPSPTDECPLLPGEEGRSAAVQGRGMFVMYF